jgi:hypothetical protein
MLTTLVARSPPRRLDLDLGQRRCGGQPRGVGLQRAIVADVEGTGAAQACLDRSRQCRVRAEMGDDEEIAVTLPIAPETTRRR